MTEKPQHIGGEVGKWLTSLKLGIEAGDPKHVLLGDLARVREALAPQAAHTAQHPDDVTAWLAVDLFAAAMKAKLAASRLRGRSGWDDPAQCEVNYLADCLIDHCGKVNSAVDIANFAMMIWRRTDGKDSAFIPEANKAARLKWEAERQAAPTSGEADDAAFLTACQRFDLDPTVADLRSLWNVAQARAVHQAPRPNLSAEAINALPELVRHYIMWLETDADPAGTLGDNWRLTQENAALRKLVAVPQQKPDSLGRDRDGSGSDAAGVIVAAEAVVPPYEQFCRALQADFAWAWSWHCNLAMLAQDAGAPHREANERAADFMERAFGVKVNDCAEFKALMERSK